MRLAIFDIDGTLVTGPSTEKRFFLWLLRRGNLGPRQMASFLWFNLRWLHRYGRHVAKKNKAYLNGLQRLEIENQAALFVAANIKSKLFAPAVLRLRRHQAAGHRVVLLSGTLVPIARALAQSLDVKHVIASDSVPRKESYSALPPSIHPFGASKLSFLSPLCAQYGVSANDVYAYADSIHDLPLLKAVGHPVAVCPDRKLLEFAGARGWQVVPETGLPCVADAHGDPI